MDGDPRGPGVPLGAVVPGGESPARGLTPRAMLAGLNLPGKGDILRPHFARRDGPVTHPMPIVMSGHPRGTVVPLGVANTVPGGEPEAFRITRQKLDVVRAGILTRSNFKLAYPLVIRVHVDPRGRAVPVREVLPHGEPPAGRLAARAVLASANVVSAGVDDW